MSHKAPGWATREDEKVGKDAHFPATGPVKKTGNVIQIYVRVNGEFDAGAWIVPRLISAGLPVARTYDPTASDVHIGMKEFGTRGIQWGMYLFRFMEQVGKQARLNVSLIVRKNNDNDPFFSALQPRGVYAEDYDRLQQEARNQGRVYTLMTLDYHHAGGIYTEEASVLNKEQIEKLSNQIRVLWPGKFQQLKSTELKEFPTELQQLEEMGYNNRDLNIYLLDRYRGNVKEVVQWLRKAKVGSGDKEDIGMERKVAKDRIVVTYAVEEDRVMPSVDAFMGSLFTKMNTTCKGVVVKIASGTEPCDIYFARSSAGTGRYEWQDLLERFEQRAKGRRLNFLIIQRKNNQFETKDGAPETEKEPVLPDDKKNLALYEQIVKRKNAALVTLDFHHERGVYPADKSLTNSRTEKYLLDRFKSEFCA